ncbi:ubiquitinyl hydrolase [Fragilaria crotonensis]|nr:ubiquitinyl hydrolase [Fragilaria crotonensis]
MNAVLQALAHAPELCLAIDYEPHQLTCPIARGNEERRRTSPGPSCEGPSRKRSTRKSRRSGKKSPCTDSDDSVDMEFCTLCEFEDHITEVHARSRSGDPVAPEVFVNGFVEQVAPPWFKLGVQEDSHEFLRILIEAMQKSSALASKATGHGSVHDNPENEKLYPFKLFRGTVESNVCCDSCHAMNSTIDPIEDIGLEVTHTSGSALSDLSSAFQRFTKVEPLAEYKCDRCGKMGRATKQSRLASIPPILTLHLKRFRYGSDGKPLPPPARRGREVSQLLGASGSAKIEGHIKFLEIFDLKPFLTEQLSGKVKNMFCRLFAVVVHSGKNSHSGHYVAYVRNISKNEWWKMDDARVSRATSQEVLNAEAYMLFYRVVDHPVAQDLRAKQAEVATFATSSTMEAPALSATAAPLLLPRHSPENIEFTPEFFKLITAEASKGKNGHGPLRVSSDDVQGGIERFRPGVLELISKLIKQNGGVADVLRRYDSNALSKATKLKAAKRGSHCPCH